jgi:hypothetical protein
LELLLAVSDVYHFWKFGLRGGKELGKVSLVREERRERKKRKKKGKRKKGRKIKPKPLVSSSIYLFWHVFRLYLMCFEVLN